MLRKYDAYLIGYYGMHNTGDDALLLATQFGAQSELGCRNLSVSTPTDFRSELFQHTPSTLRYPQQFKGQNRLIHYYHAARSKRVIFGGGSVLHSASDINLKRQLMRLSNPEQSAALGVSIGPFVNSKAEQACKAFLNECGFIGVRDTDSYDIAKNLAPNANVEKTFDLAAILKIHPQFKVSNHNRRGILFNLCPVAINAFGQTNQAAEERRVTNICQTIYRIWEETKEPITLINLNGQSDGDTKISAIICNKLQGKVPISVLPYCSNPFFAIEEISKYKAIISMRLHGCILAYLSSTPTLALNYHAKCREWCQQIDLPMQYQFEADNFQPQKLAETITQGMSNGFNLPTLPVLEAVQMSLKNWSKHYANAKNFGRYSVIQ